MQKIQENFFRMKSERNWNRAWNSKVIQAQSWLVSHGLLVISEMWHDLLWSYSFSRCAQSCLKQLFSYWSSSKHSSLWFAMLRRICWTTIKYLSDFWACENSTQKWQKCTDISLTLRALLGTWDWMKPEK